MKAFLRLSAVLVLASLAFAADPGPAPATGSAILEFDHSGLDVEGNAEIIAGFELATVAAPAVVVAVPPCATSGAMTCQSVLTGLNLLPGVHSLQVRAVDTSGNKSDWSDPLSIVIDPVPPAKPTGCRLFR